LSANLITGRHHAKSFSGGIGGARRIGAIRKAAPAN
jgi:hypothetical protein